MSVDPSAIIVGLAAAFGGMAQGADLPEPVQRAVAEQVRIITDDAPGLAGQIEVYAGQLSPEARTRLAGAVDAAVAALGGLPARPVPEQEPPRSPAPLLDRGPDMRGEELPPPRVSGPSTTAPASIVSAGSSVPVPDPSIYLSEETSAQIGSIAVFVPWFRKAGEVCDGVSAPVLAALYSVENGFRHGPTAPVSPAGARGPGQFMPGTWAHYGKDADGDGRADILGVADSVMASAHLLCDMYGRIEQWKAQGEIVGDTLDLTLAGYNAGLGAIRSYRGMPSGTYDYENQTKPYVAKIRASEPRYSALLDRFRGPSDGVGGRIVEAAVRYLGLPYVWGGGNVHGPSGGGFDCSGLTSYAVHVATSGLVLPRTSETQWGIGVEVPIEDARPGDLLFGNWGPAGPGHVAVYIGNGQMVHAPTTGDVVRIAPVLEGMKARRVA